MEQEGGRIYGEGAKGVVMDVPYAESDTNTLYEVLKDIAVESITLIGSSRSLRLSKETEIDELKEYLKGSKGVVCKIFKSRIFHETPQEVMENEIEGMDGMIHIFKGELSKYTTIQFMEFYKFKFLGMIVKTSKKKIHMTFNVGCADRADMINHTESSLKQMIEDVLETLVKIQKYNVIHTDIKPDNIVYCERDKRFKLIDWELSNSVKYGDRIHGSLALSSPIGMYVNGYGSSVIPTLIYAGTYIRQRKFLSSPIFKHLYRTTMMEFPMVLKLYKSKEELFNKYKDTIDIYGLGVSVALLCVLNGINYEKFASFVEKSVSMINPYKNAVEALKEIRKL
jgi:serine/threonine protein kinase